MGPGGEDEPAVVPGVREGGLRRHRRYVSSLGPADLERKVDTGFVGEQTVGYVLGNICVGHVAEHNGEIAALKGVQGLKGLPF